MGIEQAPAEKKKRDPLIGTKISDRYEITSLIGHGATTSVYKGQDTQRNRPVAIKLLHTHSIASEMTVRRFEQECKTLALLKHNNIVAHYDSGTNDQDQPFMVMEYLEGTTIKQLIENEGAIEVKRALGIFIQACAGLSVAHEKDIVHRDMKPANIMVVKDAQGADLVKILDFGVAKLLIQGETFQTKTQTGEMLGTLLYMSPEQCLDQDLDGRSDVYSLGCVLYEALTAKPPICGRTAFETMNKHLSEKPAKLAIVRPDLHFPWRLERIVQKACEKDAKLRFQKITDFEFELKDLLTQMLSGTVEQAPVTVPSPVLSPMFANSPKLTFTEKITIFPDPAEDPVEDLTSLLAESEELPAPPTPDVDRSREGTIAFLATESIDVAEWQKIYADVIGSYSISVQEVIDEQHRVISRKFNLKKMEKLATERFKKLDLNGDGFISKEELVTALKTKGLMWLEVDFITFLLQRLDDIRSVVPAAGQAAWPKSPTGISQQDITEYFRTF
ncbi:MAG TPA: protein kinase [Oculatellaceae cyanobacterium]